MIQEEIITTAIDREQINIVAIDRNPEEAVTTAMLRTQEVVNLITREVIKVTEIL